MNDHGNLTRARFKATIAVFAVIQNNKGQILLIERANTGYMDGFYDFPSGHLEAGELLPDGAAREVLEEVGLIVNSNDLELFHVNQNNAAPDLPYMNFIFRAKSYLGTPKIGEPQKIANLNFFALDDLPKVTPQIREALKHIKEKTVSFSYFTAKDFDA